MSLLGKANWWLPSWLGRILPRMDLEGSDMETQAPGEEPDQRQIAA
jgi:RND superfamily putative drug exporter